MKIKDKLIKIKDKFKSIFKKFPVTLVGIFIITLIGTFLYDTEIEEEFINKIIAFFAISTLGNFFIETKWNESKGKNILKFIISSIIALFFVIVLDNEGYVFGIDMNIERVFICYTLSLGILIVYNSFKNSEIDIGQYFIKVISSLFTGGVIYAIVSVGSLIILMIFSTLIFEIKWSIISKIEALIFGFIYMPRVIYSLSDLDNEIGKFAKVIFKYVLGILLTISFAIIYMYMIKIFVLREIPSNEIFRILSGLFIIGCPIWIMAEYFQEEDFLSKINAKLPVLFIPFIFLQIYAIGIRINQYGLTTMRYLCCALIIFEILYYIIYFRNKEKIHNIFIVQIVMILVIVLCPFINVYKLPLTSQSNILKKYADSSNLSKEDYEKKIGAYRYLKNSEDGKKIIKEILTKEEIEEMSSNNGGLYDSYYDEYRNIDYIYDYKKIKSIDIDGYIYLYNVCIDNENYKELFENKIESDSFKNILQQCIIKNENSKTSNSFLEEQKEIVLENGNKLIIENINMEYNAETHEINNFTIYGYLLTYKNMSIQALL